MTNTTFEEMYQIFLSKIQDYKQRNLFLKNEKVATALCKAYLMKAIARFINCKKDIQHPLIDIASFNCELDIIEKDILSDLMVEAWLDRVILDITQMNLSLNDNDWAKALVWYNWKPLYFKLFNCWKILKINILQHKDEISLSVNV